eukprot:COSAG02_NODE_868_length_16360_cov_12.608204_7_plen_1171_part_00
MSEVLASHRQCYPTICNVAFAAFICRSLTPTDSVLESDDSVLCEEPRHIVIQVLSSIVVVMVACGLPLAFGYILIRKASIYQRDTEGSNVALAKKVAEDLKVDEKQASFVIRDITIGEDYSFLMDAYVPAYLYWEALDMLRKLALVGLVLLVGRGSVAQLNAALFLSFGFFALQVKVCPYKISEDNVFRAITECHVFVVIVSALTLQKINLTREVMGETAYDWTLLATFILMVPVSFVVAVVTKVRHVHYVLGQADNPSRNAFDRCIVGLETEEDVETMKAYLETMRMEVASADFARVLDGTQWTAKNRGSGSVQIAVTKEAYSGTEDNQAVTAVVAQVQGAKESFIPGGASLDASSVDVGEATGKDDSPADDFYDKFTGGFEGTFADLSDYFGGLEKMIGECRKDLMAAMEEEHCAVATGYGASDDTFVTSSYRVTSTPRQEWLFVVAPAVVGDMDAGIDRETGRSRGNRVKIPAEKLLKEAAPLITKSFANRRFSTVITPDDILEIGLRVEEVIALRLYTGPMFEIYNGLLRAYGNKEARGIIPSYALVGAGQDVRGRFTTTLHVLNSGVLKLAKLQPAIEVYRGISGMKLPKAFTNKNKRNVRGGVEYGFMSTTTDENVAMSFAKNGDATTASTLVVASMGMIDCGATLDWLSQYPHEREILLPPLTAMEVVEIEDFVDSGAFQIRKLHVRLNTNMVSMTIENLLSVRKKQVSELVDIVARDLQNHAKAADIGERTNKLRAAQAKVQYQPSDSFNDNKTFLHWAQQKVLDLMPQTGDCIQELHGHTRDVYGLVATKGGFTSSSWDGTLRVWSLGDDSTYTSTGEIKLPSASLSMVSMGSDRVASSQFNGVVSICSVVVDTHTAESLGQRAAAALAEGDIDGAEKLMAQAEAQLGSATTALMYENSSSPVVSLAALSAASSKLRSDDVTVSVDETPTLIPSPDTTMWLASGSIDGSVSLWAIGETSRLVQSVGGSSQVGHGFGLGNVGHTEAVRAVMWTKFNGDNVLVSGSFDRKIIVWKLTSGGQLERVMNLGSADGALEGAVTVLACIDAGRASIASAGENGVVKLWDLNAPSQATRTIVLRGTGVCSLAWLGNLGTTSSAHGWLACGMGDNTIILCDTVTGRAVTSMHGHSGAVHALLWLQVEGWLVSGSSDATVRTWRVRGGAS